MLHKLKRAEYLAVVIALLFILVLSNAKWLPLWTATRFGHWLVFVTFSCGLLAAVLNGIAKLFNSGKMPAKNYTSEIDSPSHTYLNDQTRLTVLCDVIPAIRLRISSRGITIQYGYDSIGDVFALLTKVGLVLCGILTLSSMCQDIWRLGRVMYWG